MVKIKTNDAALIWQEFQARRDKSEKPKPKATSTEQMTMDIVAESAADDYALYQKTGNGVLIWKIYRLYRKAGLTVPDYILGKLDSYADGVIAGGDALLALELKKAGAKGGSQGATANAKQEHERDIVFMCRALRTRHPPERAYAMTAARFKTKVQVVKNTYLKWVGKEKRGAKVCKTVKNTRSLIDLLYKKK